MIYCNKYSDTCYISKYVYRLVKKTNIFNNLTRQVFEECLNSIFCKLVEKSYVKNQTRTNSKIYKIIKKFNYLKKKQLLKKHLQVVFIK